MPKLVIMCYNISVIEQRLHQSGFYKITSYNELVGEEITYFLKDQTEVIIDTRFYKEGLKIYSPILGVPESLSQELLS